MIVDPEVPELLIFSRIHEERYDIYPSGSDPAVSEGVDPYIRKVRTYKFTSTEEHENFIE